MSKLLAVENDAKQRSRIMNFFRGNGYSVDGAGTYQETLEQISSNVYDVVCLDCRAPGGSPVDLLQSVLEANDDTMIIMTFTAEVVEDLVASMKVGAFDSIQKPYKLVELYLKVERAIRVKRLEYEAQNLRGERNLIYRTDDFIANSPKIRRVLEKVGKVAKSDTSVLLLGESGTGKELLAGTIHYSSHRAEEAFIRVNCAALPDDLLESELFGHEKGAFTGADKQRVGRFEQADGGSILLDEIGDMSLRTQAKILRVLQEKEFERLGSNRTIRVDVRIISATNKDLTGEIDKGNFRDDLFYRLNVISITLPPLRERKEDILPLMYTFLRKFSGDLKKHAYSISDTAKEIVLHHDWPGNIRELQNTMERAVLLADTDTIGPADLEISGARTRNSNGREPFAIPVEGIRLADVEKQIILQALEMTEWVQKEAATLLGVSRRSLNYKISNHGITHPKWKKNT